MTKITAPSEFHSDATVQPTGAARLSISLRASGANLEVTGPISQAQTVIITSWMAVIGIAGIAGAVLMLRTASGQGLGTQWLVLADLAFTLVVILLIASRSRPSRQGGPLEAPRDGSLGENHCSAPKGD